MARNQETFEQRHRKALEKAHAELRATLQHRPGSYPYCGIADDDFICCVSFYRDAMGYSQDPEQYEATIDQWLDAVQKAWRLEAREKGDRMVLGDVLDRAIRAGIIAIGERWPEERMASHRAA